MKIISITSNCLETIFSQIQAQIGGKLEIKSKEYTLLLNNDIAKGYISGICVEKAITYMEYDLVFKQDISILSKLENPNSIHFDYCSKGQLVQSFGEYGKKNRLRQFQTGIFSNSSEKSSFLSFRKDEDVKLSMMTIDAETVADEELKDELLNTFMFNQETDLFSYVGSYNLKIAEKIEHLNAISQKGVVRNMLINSTVRMILGLEIEQHKLDLQNTENNFRSLTKGELEGLKEVSELIRNYPETPYSLKYLSKKSGLSPIKLQEGFKIMHKRTVTDFIRNVRVEAAEKLIRTSNLNISQIVYTIGLTSKSYFSKIFKEKYNCSPKYYQNNQN